MRPSLSRLALLSLTATAVACSGADEEAPAIDAEPAMEETAPAPSAEAPAGTVTITEPADGSEVEGPSVTVRLDTDVQIMPAGDTTPGSGHHHLYLDADLTPADQPVPTRPGEVIHMGDGSEEYVFEDVAPGEHRLIAVVADGLHIPLQPWVVDTVTFTVR